MVKSSIPRSIRTKVRELLKELAAELPPKTKPGDAIPYYARSEAYYKHVDTAPALLRRVRKHGIKATKTAAGVARRAVISDTFVIKFSRYEGDQRRLVSEANYIKEMCDRGYEINFPETHVVKIAGVIALVQEKIDMSHAWAGRKYSRNRTDAYDIAESLACELGIDDIHEGNFGWRTAGNGEKIPVFVDVDFRYDNSHS